MELMDTTSAVRAAANLDRLKTGIADRLALFAASTPYLCEERCDARLPDWMTASDFILADLLKSGAIQDDPVGDEETGAASQQSLNSGANVGELIKELVAGLYAQKGHLDTEKICGCSGKDAATAEALKVKGTALFTASNFLLAIKFYSVAMITSPDGGAMAILRSNRSAAAFRMEQYENALDDISAALELGFPSEKAGKLLLRKAECLRALGRSQELDDFFRSPHSVFTEAEKSRWTNLKSLPPLPKSLVKPSMNLGKFMAVETVVEALAEGGRFVRCGLPLQPFSWLSLKVKLIREEESGKFRLVAAEDISLGEILAVIKPFAMVPLAESADRFERCHHCTSSIYRSAEYIEENPRLANHIRIHNPVACPRCSTVLFCSDECRQEAEQAYHRFECGHLPVLRSLGPEAHLALRVLYTSGPGRHMELFHEEEEAEEKELAEKGSSEKQFTKCLPTCARLDQIDDEYRRLYYTGWEIATDSESKYRSLITIHLLLNLATVSKFLENNTDFTPASLALFRSLNQLKRHCLVVGRPRTGGRRSLSAALSEDRFQVATGLVGIVEPVGAEQKANLHIQFLNPLEILSSNLLLAKATKPIAAGEKLSLALASGGGHVETADANNLPPITDLLLLGERK